LVNNFLGTPIQGISFDAYITFVGQSTDTEIQIRCRSSARWNWIKLYSQKARKFLETFQGEFIYSSSKWLRGLDLFPNTLAQSVSQRRSPAAIRQIQYLPDTDTQIAKVLRMWRPPPPAPPFYARIAAVWRHKFWDIFKTFWALYRLYIGDSIKHRILMKPDQLSRSPPRKVSFVILAIFVCDFRGCSSDFLFAWSIFSDFQQSLSPFLSAYLASSRSLSLPLTSRIRSGCSPFPFAISNSCQATSSLPVM